MKRLSVALLAMAVAIASLSLAPGVSAAQPDITAGLAYDAGGTDAPIWTPSKVFFYDGFAGTASEVTAVRASISSFQGIVYPQTTDNHVTSSEDQIVPDIVCGLIDEGTYSLIWIPSRLFSWSFVGGATEITSGGSISGVQGIIDEGAYSLIWTPSRLFSWSFVGGATEITSGGSISGVQGIIDEGTYSLIWTPSRLFSWSFVGGATEITSGGSISGVEGIIDEGTYSLIWTPSRLFSWSFVGGAAEITSGGSITCYNPADVTNVQVVIHQQYEYASGAGVVGTPAFTRVVYAGSSPAAAVVPSSAPPSAHSTVLGGAPLDNTVLILGPNPVSGVVTANSMKLFAFAPSVGGLAELPDLSGSSGPPYAALAGGLAAAAVALTAGAWYARRRWLG